MSIGYGEPVPEHVGRAHSRLRDAIRQARGGPMRYDVRVILGPEHPCNDITHIDGAEVYVLDYKTVRTNSELIPIDGALLAIPVSRCQE